MTEKICINCIVSGRVQGVWFRASTQTEAQKLGVTGWVRNLPDGRVEVMASGTREQIEKLKAWLQRGPERAEVKEFVCEEVGVKEFEGFQIV